MLLQKMPIRKHTGPAFELHLQLAQIPPNSGALCSCAIPQACIYVASVADRPLSANTPAMRCAAGREAPTHEDLDLLDTYWCNYSKPTPSSTSKNLASPGLAIRKCSLGVTNAKTSRRRQGDTSRRVFGTAPHISSQLEIPLGILTAQVRTDTWHEGARIDVAYRIATSSVPRAPKHPNLFSVNTCRLQLLHAKLCAKHSAAIQQCVRCLGQCAASHCP